ncbi:hypothetical protein KKA47_05640 [bacterium]|nr:hypothetical protein [bacterium]
MLVVLKKISNYWDIKSEIEDLAYKVTFEKGRQIVTSTVLIDEDEFKNGSSPLIINIRKEGIKQF